MVGSFGHSYAKTAGTLIVLALLPWPSGCGGDDGVGLDARGGPLAPTRQRDALDSRFGARLGVGSRLAESDH